MSKRKVTFDENVETEKLVSSAKSRRFKGNHSLDSDEEEHDEEVGNAEQSDAHLEDEDIEGQEDETIRFDGEIAVTPFNLKEEMEEGHFDAQGSYVANKDSEAIHDGWLDSVDWKRVSDSKAAVQDAEDLLDTSSLKLSNKDTVVVMKQMALLLNPGETVLKGIRRLGGKQATAGRQRPRQWHKKTKGIEEKQKENIENSSAETENKERMLSLTALADRLLQNGDFTIYEKTYEKLNHQVKTFETQFEDAEDDDALEAAFQGKEGSNTSKSNEQSTDKPVDDEVQWEYKWNSDEGTEVFGPFATSEMFRWQEDGYFNDGVLCRKSGSEGNFYSIKRMDFDLYM